MTQATFSKVTRSEKPMYGPRRILACGYDLADLTRLAGLLAACGLAGVGVVHVADDQAETALVDLFALSPAAAPPAPSRFSRAVIVAGITEKELHALLDAYRKSGMPPQLWAALTPTSEKWPLTRLLAELEAERKAMQRRQKQPQHR